MMMIKMMMLITKYKILLDYNIIYLENGYSYGSNDDYHDHEVRVAECQIFYTEQIFQTKFYPKKST